MLLDAFFEGQRDATEPLRPQKAAEELAALIRIPLAPHTGAIPSVC